MPDLRSHPSHPERRRRPSGRRTIVRAVVTELSVALEPACRDPFLDGCGEARASGLPRTRPAVAPATRGAASADSPPTTLSKELLPVLQQPERLRMRPHDTDTDAELAAVVRAAAAGDPAALHRLVSASSRCCAASRARSGSARGTRTT